MRKRQVLVATGAAVLALGGTSLAGANSASADQVWQQSIGRASATSTCPASSEADRATGWSEWGASWEQWANDSHGGFVCTRSTTWAYEASDTGPSYPSAGCLYWGSPGLGSYLYVNFLGGWTLPIGSALYEDSSCQNGTQILSPTGDVVVYAPEGSSQAETLCDQVLPNTLYISSGSTDNVFACFTSY